jgi:hypothetical protein
MAPPFQEVPMLFLIVSLAFADDTKRPIVDLPPTAIELAHELNKLQGTNPAPWYHKGIEIRMKTLEVVGYVPCTTEDGKNEICTWREGESVGFSADPMGPYRRWEIAIPEQIRRLKILNGD